MVKREIKELFNNKLLLLVIVAIILIPVIYAGTFVASIMDPYGNVDQLPVAVVNNDQPTEYEGKTLQVGEDLVKELKENKALQFNFVDQKTAEEGLENGTFYMTITIPADFSKHATTLMDEHPQKMELLYATNPGTNYIASKLSESAILKIKTSIQEAVTKSYAETVFDSIAKIGDGMEEAADGAGKLKDGMNEASDGNEKITKNLKKLSSSTLVFKDGAETLNVGIKDYTNGVSKVNKGAKQLDAGVEKLTGSTPELINGVNTLCVGVQQYTSGVSQIHENMPTLTSGSQTISAGAKQLKQGVDDFNTGLEQYTEGVDGLANGVSAYISNGIEPMEQGIQQLYAGVVVGTEEKPSLCDGIKNANNGASAIETQLKPLYNGVKNLPDSTSIGGGMTAGQIKALYSGVSQLQTGLAAMNLSVNGTEESTEGSVKGALTALNSGVTQLTSSTTGASLQDQIKQGATSVKAARTQIQTGASAIKAGLEGDGTAQNPGLVAGLASLDLGIQQVSAGVAKLDANSATLATGASQLAVGAKQLGAGADALSNGTKTLANGTKTLVKNNKKLTDGTKKLADGAEKIQEGSGKLAEGSEDLGEGIGKLKDGSEDLESALQDGAEEVKDSEASDDTIDMFAGPVEEQGTKLLEVENNGHGMLPYMMSVGLWVGALAFCLIYPLMSYKGKLKSGLSWWASKAVILYPVAMLQGVLLIFLLRSLIGFHPVDMGRTIGLAVAAAIAFTSIMYFFNITLGKVGSFVMLIYMVIQLAGSAGTYPVELSPHFVSVIHKYLPFTYTVDGFRRTIAGGESIAPCVMILLIIAVVFSILTIIAFQIKTKRIRENKFIFYQWLEEKGLA